MSDLPDWYYKRPLSPTERLARDGIHPGKNASDILTGPTYDVRAHYRRVKTLYEAYPFRDTEACTEITDRAFDVILQHAPRRPNEALVSVFRNVIDQVMR